MKNMNDGYGRIAKALHWLSALIVLGLLALGYYMVGLDFGPFKLTLYGWHKSFGTLLLGLVVLRLFWRFSHPPPGSLPTHKRWEKKLAGATHILLYLAMIVMPLSGWIMSSAGDFHHSFFGLFEMPDLVGKDEALFNVMMAVHETFSYILVAAFFLHVVGAYKHFIVDRDQTLQRMLPKRHPVLGAVAAGVGSLIVLLAIAFFLVGSESHEEHNHDHDHGKAGVAQIEETLHADDDHGTDEKYWEIDRSESRLAFEAMVYGKPLHGVFEDFSGEIRFDPDHPEEGQARIQIDMSSVKTENSDYDGYLAMEPWFDTESFPESVFTVEKFEKLNGNRYIARGMLRIRDVSLPLSLPFFLDISETEEGHAEAEVRGQVSLNRIEYDVGYGDWADTKTVGNAVHVKVLLKASRT